MGFNSAFKGLMKGMFCYVVSGVEKVRTVSVIGCKPNEFECRSGECIPGRWICDSQKV